MSTDCFETQRFAVLDGGPLPELKALDEGLPRLLEIAAEESATLGVFFIDRDGTDSFLSYPALLQEARLCLAGLQRNGLEAGDQIIFQIESPRGIIIALWACFLSGMIPVIIPVIRSIDKKDLASRRMLECLELLDRPRILTTRKSAAVLRFHLDRLEQPVLKPLELEDMLTPLAPPIYYPHRHGSDKALLLWTSGSTGKPKLVTISHRNILASIIGSSDQLSLGTKDICLNWLPLYHVGGLMRSIRDVYMRCQSIQVSIDYVLEDPLRWLDLLQQHRVTATWASNFSYDLVVERLRRNKTDRAWNLSAIRSMCSSGEPVSLDSMTRFYGLLAKFGLRAESLHQSWGLTEACSATHSLDYFVAAQRGERATPDAGIPVRGLSVRIVDEEDHIVSLDTKGHVQIYGPSCVSECLVGEFKEPKSLLSPDGWLRTGDIGYIHDSRLFILGRNGQWIVRNGRKFAVNEIEDILRKGDGLTSTLSVITIVQKAGRQEELVVFFEVDKEATAFSEEIAARIQGVLTRSAGFGADYLVPIPKTLLSGNPAVKTPRTGLRAQFEQGCFDQVFPGSKWRKISTAPPANNSVENLIASLFAMALGEEGIAPDDDFFKHGGNSIQAVSLMSLLQSRFGPDAPRLDDLFRYPTPQLLAASILVAGEKSDPEWHGKYQADTRFRAVEGRQRRRSERIIFRRISGGAL